MEKNIVESLKDKSLIEIYKFLKQKNIFSYYNFKEENKINFIEYIFKINSKLKFYKKDKKDKKDNIQKKTLEYCIANHSLIDKIHYDKIFNANNNCDYIISKFNIEKYVNESKEIKSYKVLEHLINSKKLYNIKKLIKLEDCIIMDYLNINDTFIPSLHTDLDFNYFESNGINIWVLEENTESYGNMFLLESTKLDNIDNSILIIKTFKKRRLFILKVPFKS